MNTKVKTPSCIDITNIDLSPSSHPEWDGTVLNFVSSKGSNEEKVNIEMNNEREVEL